MFTSTAVLLLCAAIGAPNADDLQYALADGLETGDSEEFFVNQDVRPPAAPLPAPAAAGALRR